MEDSALTVLTVKGLRRLEWIFDQKGAQIDGLAVVLSNRDWSSEELFGLLRDAENVYEKLKVPYEVLIASVWKQIQARVKPKERGYLMRHTFGEMRGPALMQRYTKLSRIVKYWDKIGEPITVGLPFWLYEEIATLNMPATSAIAKVADWKKGQRVRREEIREEAVALLNGYVAEPEEIVVTTIETTRTASPKSTVILVKDSKTTSRPMTTAVVKPVETMPKLLPRKPEPMQNLWQAAGPEKIDEKLICTTFTVDLPRWVIKTFDAAATKQRISVTKLLENFAKDLEHGFPTMDA